MTPPAIRKLGINSKIIVIALELRTVFFQFSFKDNLAEGKMIGELSCRVYFQQVHY